MRKIWPTFALPLLLAAASVTSWAAQAAEPPRVEPSYRPVHRLVVVPSTGLVPDCAEKWDAELLRCGARLPADENAYPVVARRRTMLTFPAKPYPQLFNWDHP